MTKKQFSDEKFRAAVWRLSSEMDNLSQSWLAAGIEFPGALDERKYKEVGRLFDQYSKDVIACCAAALLLLSSFKGAAGEAAAIMNIDEIKNRPRYQGKSVKRAKANEGKLILQMYDQLSPRKGDIGEAARIIAQKLNEGRKLRGERLVNVNSLRRKLCPAELHKLRVLYG